MARLSTSDPSLAYARRAADASAKLRTDLAGLGDITTPPSYPSGDFGRAWLGSPRCCRPASPALRLARRTRQLRHACGPGGEPAVQPGAGVADAERVPARPRAARSGRSRADARLERVRSAGARERAGHGPRRRRHRNADRLAGQRPDGRQFPGPRHRESAAASTGSAIFARRPTSAAFIGRSSRTGWASTRAPIIPGASGFEKYPLVA